MNRYKIFIFLFLICLIATSIFIKFNKINLNGEKAKAIAITELEKWVSKNTLDANQIKGATFQSLSVENSIIHVTLFKDVSIKNENGIIQNEGTHFSYFHVYLNLKYDVLSVKRGPDELS